MSGLTKRVAALEQANKSIQAAVCVHYADGAVMCGGRLYADAGAFARAIERQSDGETVIYRMPDNGREGRNGNAVI
jgi:hypothetical protein